MHRAYHCCLDKVTDHLYYLAEEFINMYKSNGYPDESQGLLDKEMPESH